MKSRSLSRPMAWGTVLLLIVTLASSGCASGPHRTEPVKPQDQVGTAQSSSAEQSSQPEAVNGPLSPNILQVKSEPSRVELNRDLQPIRSAVITAEVDPGRAPVSDVLVRFKNLPLEVPMQQMSETTWRAELSARQLEALAVSGETVTYDAYVIAKSDNGQIATSDRMVRLAVTTPNITGAPAS